MVYKYTPEQSRRFRETGERPRTSQLKHYKPGKPYVEPTIITKEGRTISEAQQRTEIARDIQINYLDRGLNPPGKLLRMAGLRVVESKQETPVVQRRPHPHIEQGVQMQLAQNYQNFLRGEGLYAKDKRADDRYSRTSRVKVKDLPFRFVEQKEKKPGYVEAKYKEVDTYLKKHVGNRIPTLKMVEQAGYDWGKKYPEKAKKIFEKSDSIAKLTRLLIPEKYGLPAGQAAHAFAKGGLDALREHPTEAIAFAAFPIAVRGVGAVAKAAGITKVLTATPARAFISAKTLQAVSGIIGAAYSKNVYDRVTAPVETGAYLDGKVIEENIVERKNGDIQVVQVIEQIPVTRKPTRNEQIERVGAIWTTEFATMGITEGVLSRGMKGKYKPWSDPKKTRKTITTKAPKLTSADKVKAFEKAFKKRLTKKDIKKLVADIKKINKKSISERPKTESKTPSKSELKRIQSRKDYFFDREVKRLYAEAKRLKIQQKNIRQLERMKKSRSRKDKTRQTTTPPGYKRRMREFISDVKKLKLQEKDMRQRERMKKSRSRKDKSGFRKKQYKLQDKLEKLYKFVDSSEVNIGRIDFYKTQKPMATQKPLTKSTLPTKKAPTPKKQKPRPVEYEEVETGSGMVMLMEKPKMEPPALKQKQVTLQKTKVKPKTKTTVKTKTRTKSKVKTSVKVVPIIKTGVKAKVKTKTSVKTKVKTGTKVVPIMKSLTKTKVKTRTSVKTKVAVKTRTKTKQKTRAITKLKHKPKQTQKIKPLPLKFPKKSGKPKKKKSGKKSTKSRYVKNPVPSLKQFVG